VAGWLFSAGAWQQFLVKGNWKSIAASHAIHSMLTKGWREGGEVSWSTDIL